MKRRTLLAGLLSGLGTGAAMAQGRRPATPGQFTGPFYPLGELPIRPNPTTYKAGTAQGRLWL